MWLSLVKYRRVLTWRCGDDTPSEYLPSTAQTVTKLDVHKFSVGFAQSFATAQCIVANNGHLK